MVFLGNRKIGQAPFSLDEGGRIRFIPRKFSGPFPILASVLSPVKVEDLVHDLPLSVDLE